MTPDNILAAIEVALVTTAVIYIVFVAIDDSEFEDYDDEHDNEA